MKKLTKNKTNESRRKEEMPTARFNEAEFCWTKKKKKREGKREKKGNIYSCSKRSLMP